MAKIDYTKVEQKLADGMHALFAKKLMAGEPLISERALSFYRLDTSRPKPHDSVVDTLEELEQEAADAEALAASQLSPTSPETPPPLRIRHHAEPPPPPPPEEHIQTIEETPSFRSPLITLKDHILWLLRRKIDPYPLMGTTRDEIRALKHKSPLTEADTKRITALLTKASFIKKQLMKKLHLDDDQALIAREIKRHKTKRFNIKETWLPL